MSDLGLVFAEEVFDTPDGLPIVSKRGYIGEGRDRKWGVAGNKKREGEGNGKSGLVYKRYFFKLKIIPLKQQLANNSIYKIIALN